MQTLISFLQNDLGVPKSEVPKIVPYFHKELLKKKDFLVKEGSPCEKLCLVEQGYVRFFTYAETKAITHWIFGANQFITDVASFYLHEPAKWNIQALTDTHLFTLSVTGFQQLRQEIPKWDVYEKLLLVKLMSALENRVFALLSMSAEERYQYLYTSDSKMFSELPLQYLASMLGMTPETLSRIRGNANS